MCGICGCSDTNNHPNDVHHHHHHDHGHTVPIEQAIMAENHRYAAQNAAYFAQKNMLAINLMSSPGSGKTTLLSHTIAHLPKSTPAAIIVGDQQTDADAKQLQQSGAQALQINTGQVCHLDAHNLGHALQTMNLANNSLLFIENIGNLVCPALFSLGEHRRIVILSVTEGENKPLKYPDMFRIADLVLISKIDLLPYIDFDIDLCETYIKQIQPNAAIIRLSSKSHDGMDLWLNWLQKAYKMRHAEQTI
ncbi:hydrogenase nickel incorporation protein HypB [Legionella sp. W05-934-2]|jgi:hydrogenase nickel incorporation protein HypB|uniref:hydrogenase nickel incorporation protein HypB n=1 Tax=Legionella sp. W05-934-2 TaxID=1198649 RepID=UPI003461E8E8